jgi:hypothetical protein
VTTTILLARAVLGLEVVRQQTAREFPLAERHGWELPRLRRRTAPGAGAQTGDARVDELARLAELHHSGELSDDELVTRTRRLLDAS